MYRILLAPILLTMAAIAAVQTSEAIDPQYDCEVLGAGKKCKLTPYHLLPESWREHPTQYQVSEDITSSEINAIKPLVKLDSHQYVQRVVRVKDRIDVYTSDESGRGGRFVSLQKSCQDTWEIVAQGSWVE